MLKFFRHKNVTKIVLWGILILILPAFVMWGTGSMGKSKDKGPSYVGLINDKKISFDDFAESLRDVRCQVMLNYFNNQKILDEILKNKPLMGKLAWDRLIMAREAKRRGISVSDREVVVYIESHPLFSRNGRFDDRVYGYILRNNLGLEPRTFEETMRESIKIQKMNLMLTKDVAVTDADIREYYKKENKDFNESEFNKKKDEYSKKALEYKRASFLEDWLRGLELTSTLNIDLGNYEKYYG